MFRPVFKTSLRQGVFAATRRYTSVPTTRTVSRTRPAVFVGVAGLAWAAYTMLGDAVNNDTDEEKVKAEQFVALNSAEPEKTGFELAEEAKKELDTLEAVEVAQPGTGTSETSETPEGGSQSAAFNPETGEINWDCPCLGGMAHGPCGEEFKAAFACFVYSETEPKGIDCIGKFEAMRTCFRQHPEHYKEELYDDGEPVPESGLASESTNLKDVALETAEVAETKPATEDIATVA